MLEASPAPVHASDTVRIDDEDDVEQGVTDTSVYASTTEAAVVFASAVLRVLVVGDDPGDALLVRELLADAGTDPATHVGEIVVEHLTSLGTAIPRRREADCVLLDMNLPHARGLDAVQDAIARNDSPAAVVLTGDTQTGGGQAAVTAGSGLLVERRIAGQLLSRAVQYVERHQAAAVTAAW